MCLVCRSIGVLDCRTTEPSDYPAVVCMWKQDPSSNWQDYYCGLLMHILKTGVERFLCGKKAGPHILSRSRIRSLCLLVRFADLAKTVFSVRIKSHRCCNGSRARLECGRSWVLALVGSNQRIYHWYVLFLRSARNIKENVSSICIVLAHWNNSPWVDVSLHSDTLFWFRVNQSLLVLLNVACLAEKQHIPMIYSLIWPDQG
jgi:hypothetical protein